jgi:hypothetical protein
MKMEVTITVIESKMVVVMIMMMMANLALRYATCRKLALFLKRTLVPSFEVRLSKDE